MGLSIGDIDTTMLNKFKDVNLPQIQTIRNNGFSGMALKAKISKSPAPIKRGTFDQQVRE